MAMFDSAGVDVDANLNLTADERMAEILDAMDLLAEEYEALQGDEWPSPLSHVAEYVLAVSTDVNALRA